MLLREPDYVYDIRLTKTKKMKITISRICLEDVHITGATLSLSFYFFIGYDTWNQWTMEQFLLRVHREKIGCQLLIYRISGLTKRIERTKVIGPLKEKARPCTDYLL